MKHIAPLDSYCEKCKDKFCSKCRDYISKDNNIEHHKIILYEEVFENMNNFKAKIKDLKDIIDNFNNIKEDNNLLSIKNNLKKYYMIYNNILSNYNKENINYQVICNLFNIYNIINQIIQKLKDISKEPNNYKNLEILKKKLEKSEIHKEKKDEINLVYKVEEGGLYNIFGQKFIQQNKYKIQLFMNNDKIEARGGKFLLQKGDNVIKLIIKKDLTSLESMFKNCKSLYNFDELKYLNTNNCTNFSSSVVMIY